MGDWRIEFICASSEWHSVSYLIISVINDVIDRIMIPYPNMVIFYCCNAITLKLVDLCCETLMFRNVTADTILNESFILMTHLASWKPLVHWGFLWSSCVEDISRLKMLNKYVGRCSIALEIQRCLHKHKDWTLITSIMAAYKRISPV